MNDELEVTAPGDWVDLSAIYGHLPCFQPLLPLLVSTNSHTYLSAWDPSDPLGTTWLELALAAMERLQALRRSRIRSIAVIGTGCGLDAIAFSRLFAPERISASDLHPAVIGAARRNLDRYLDPAIRREVRLSDLFRGYPGRSRFDLVYENLPNVPDAADLLEGICSASCYRPDGYLPDPDSDRHLLTLHYNCLIEAREHLAPGGWIVCMIGGRVPWAVIDDLFTRTGYTATLLHCGLKTQTEPELVLAGYARAEDRGAEAFRFYHPIEACREIVARYRGELPERAVLDPAVLGARLEGRCVSAREALRLHRRGEKLCHTVYAVGGRRRGESEARA